MAKNRLNISKNFYSTSRKKYVIIHTYYLSLANKAADSLMAGNYCRSAHGRKSLNESTLFFVLLPVYRIRDLMSVDVCAVLAHKGILEWASG